MPDPDSGRELLVQWRASMKVSQRQASVLLKISRSFIADIECGRKKISPKLWEKISNATP
jgi:predicted transcriptional regulator